MCINFKIMTSLQSINAVWYMKLSKMTFFIVRLYIIKCLYLFIQCWMRVGVLVMACMQK